MDKPKSAIDQFVPPISLSLEEEGCLCLFHLNNSPELLAVSFESPEQLLALFLNEEYEKIVPPENLLAQDITDVQGFHQWLADFDREAIMKIVQHIYFFDSTDTGALPPSQRLRIYLTFNRNTLSVQVQERDYSCFMKSLHMNEVASESFSQELQRNWNTPGMTQFEANYRAACKAARTQNLRIPRGTMVSFQDMKDFIMWLLRETIHGEKHIKRCGFCGSYFIPQRSTKKFCSDACASKQRNADGFCGEREVGAAYRRIASNLTNKDKKQKQLRHQYCLDDGTVVSPREVLRRFYEENYSHQEAFRLAWEKLNKTEKEKQTSQQEYEAAKAAYLTWLDERLAYAKRIHIDRDSYWEG